MIDEAKTIAAEIGDESLEGFSSLSRSIVLYSYLQHDLLIQEAPRALELLRKTSSFFDLANLLTLFEWSLYVTGAPAEQRSAVHEELEPLARRLGNTAAIMLSERAQQLINFNSTGDLEAYARFAQWDLDYCRDHELEWIANSYGFLWSVDFWRGRWDEALNNARLYLEVEPPGGFDGWAWGLIFQTLAYLGRRDEAMAMWENDRLRLPVPGRPATWGSWAILHAAVEGLAILGEREASAELYPLVVETSQTGTIFVRGFDRRLVDTNAGISAHMGRRWEQAESHFAAAIETSDNAPVITEQAEARRFFAAMLAERDAPGDRDRARELLERALEIYTTIGMPRHVELAEAQLKAL